MRYAFLSITLVALFVAGCGTYSQQSRMEKRLEQVGAAHKDVVRLIAVPTDKYYRENGEEATIKRAIATLKRDLFDPGSAQVSAVRLGDFEGLAVVCGTVNARNRLGGYVGFRPFVSGVNSAFIYRETEHPMIDPYANAGLIEACK